jgi:site-specific recombinase XerC
MTHTGALAFPEENLVGWERTLVAFLVEKERRSGSARTVESYSRMLQHFFGRVGKAPDKVTAQDVFLWAHGGGLSGKEPSPVTIGARMACLSSFFRFLIRMDILQRNPCDRLERPRTAAPPARGLSAEEVRGFWQSFPTPLRACGTGPSSSLWCSLVGAGLRSSAWWQAICPSKTKSASVRTVAKVGRPDAESCHGQHWRR